LVNKKTFVGAGDCYPVEHVIVAHTAYESFIRKGHISFGNALDVQVKELQLSRKSLKTDDYFGLFW